MDKIHGNLMAWKDGVLPKSPTGKAMKTPNETTAMASSDSQPA
jgi:hypothetical protein